MSHRAALADLEKLADEHELRPGIAAAPDVECVVCMATRAPAAARRSAAPTARTSSSSAATYARHAAAITIADRGGHIGVEQTFAA